MSRIRRALAGVLLAALCGSAGAAQREPFVAVVTRVSDGDTVWVRAHAGAMGEARPRKIRLLGIDAPEICQTGGADAREALERRVLKRMVTVVPRATDDYGRLLARLQLDGDDIGAWLVAEGHAWNSGWRHRPGPFEAEEAQARRDGRGVFAAPGAQPPWQFRRLHGPCD